MRRLTLSILLFAMAPALAPSAASAQAIPPSGTNSYRINPGDELEILVWGDDRLQRTVSVLPDGTFAFPLVGQVTAAGRLPTDLEDIITKGLQPQYRGQVPRVTVSVKNPAGFQFSVIGKVKGPGTFKPGRYVNALEALSMAGGPSEFANLSDVRIIRRTSAGLRVIGVRVANALKGSGNVTASDIPQIESGDTLVVP